MAASMDDEVSDADQDDEPEIVNQELHAWCADCTCCFKAAQDSNTH